MIRIGLWTSSYDPNYFKNANQLLSIIIPIFLSTLRSIANKEIRYFRRLKFSAKVAILLDMDT